MCGCVSRRAIPGFERMESSLFTRNGGCATRCGPVRLRPRTPGPPRRPKADSAIYRDGYIRGHIRRSVNRRKSTGWPQQAGVYAVTAWKDGQRQPPEGRERIERSRYFFGLGRRQRKNRRRPGKTGKGVVLRDKGWPPLSFPVKEDVHV